MYKMTFEMHYKVKECHIKKNVIIYATFDSWSEIVDYELNTKISPNIIQARE